MISVRKKDNTIESFHIQKVIAAIKKSAKRAMVAFTDAEIETLCRLVEAEAKALNKKELTIEEMHNIVEKALDTVNPDVSESYRNYRNYKQDFVKMMDEVYQKSQSIMYRGDKENSNMDSALVSTKRSLVLNQLNKELYQKFFLSAREVEANAKGYIYIHDMSARRDTMNCCLFDMRSVLKNGFEMGHLYYSEPQSLDTAFDVIGDVVLSAASQQYGGFTVPCIDEILETYAKKSYQKLLEWYRAFGLTKEKAEEIAEGDLKKQFEQGFQGWEYKFNSVSSSRGDYPFITMTLGIGKGRFAQMAAKTMLKVRSGGQGKKNNKRPVLFPKLVFLYDENLHGKGKILESVFEAGISCSQKAMYPDWLSLSGEGYVPDIYKKYKQIVSPMGCRAFLSPWFEKGGIIPKNNEDSPVFVGRFNIGVVSLHLPMIYAKSKEEKKDFFTVLEEYLEMIRGIHLKTYAYLGELKASTNPLAYCEGGFYGGHLQHSDKIAPLFDSATASFGITALNELQRLHNRKSLVQDGEFALQTLIHINQVIERFKKEDKRLYAVYATPAENLCGVQAQQFREMYGVIQNVSDKAYVSNGFHCHVTEAISPIQKQDFEKRFWNWCNGGKIQYVKYPIVYNREAMKTLVRRAMQMGFYEGINLSLSYCDSCGHEELEVEKCPRCGSTEITKIDRMNGYLSYSRIKGDTRLNQAKMQEIKERKSM